MRSILTKRLRQVLAVLGIAATACVLTTGAADAREGYWHHGWHHWEHPHYWGHPWAYNHYYYGPRYYYYAPRTWAYTDPPAYYYGPPSINFNIPLR